RRLAALRFAHGRNITSREPAAPPPTRRMVTPEEGPEPGRGDGRHHRRGEHGGRRQQLLGGTRSRLAAATSPVMQPVIPRLARWLRGALRTTDPLVRAARLWSAADGERMSAAMSFY